MGNELIEQALAAVAETKKEITALSGRIDALVKSVEALTPRVAAVETAKPDLSGLAKADAIATLKGELTAEIGKVAQSVKDADAKITSADERTMRALASVGFKGDVPPEKNAKEGDKSAAPASLADKWNEKIFGRS